MAAPDEEVARYTEGHGDTRDAGRRLADVQPGAWCNDDSAGSTGYLMHGARAGVVRGVTGGGRSEGGAFKVDSRPTNPQYSAGPIQCDL